MDALQVREGLGQRAAHRRVEGGHRSVPLRRRSRQRLADTHLRHRLGEHLVLAFAAQVVAALDDEEVLEVEGRAVAADRAAHEQLERGLGGLVLEALRLLLLDLLRQRPRLLVGELDVDALLGQLGDDVAPPRQLGDEHALDVADRAGIDVRVGPRRLRDRRHM